ncbi:MAG: hypothetical protein JKY89_13300 [Immundisolibacteraceae bacterium]|nr:hypothetical protein [Immundisolibacteraceae bacterium]
MSKAEDFLKWCSERMGHPAQIMAARDAINEQKQTINELNSHIESLERKCKPVLDDMVTLLKGQRRDLYDGSVEVDGESAHELQVALYATHSQSLANLRADAVTDAIFNSEQIDIDGHKYVGLEDLEVNIKQMKEAS